MSRGARLGLSGARFSSRRTRLWLSCGLGCRCFLFSGLSITFTLNDGLNNGSSSSGKNSLFHGRGSFFGSFLLDGGSLDNLCDRCGLHRDSGLASRGSLNLLSCSRSGLGNHLRGYLGHNGRSLLACFPGLSGSFRSKWLGCVLYNLNKLDRVFRMLWPDSDF